MIRRAVAIATHVGHQQRSEILRWSLEDLLEYVDDVMALFREIKGVDPLADD